jgi:ADP-ribose pyrophosphatase
MTDEQSPPDGADPLEETTLDSRVIYQGGFLRVLRDDVRCPDGHLAVREYLRHPGAVMVLPLLDDGRVVLERQYRYPLRRSFIEFPAGKIEAGEPVLDCARRELWEETGYRAAEWIGLGSFHGAIGYCDEQIHIYLARGLTSGQAHADAGEVLEIFTAPFADLLAWIAAGQVTYAKTLIGAYRLEKYLADEARAAPASR